MQGDEPELPELQATYEDCNEYIMAWNIALSKEQESSRKRRESQAVPNLKMRIWDSGGQWYGIFSATARCATDMERDTEVLVRRGQAGQRALVTQMNVDNEMTIKFKFLSNLQSFVEGAVQEQDSEGVSYVIE